MCTQYELKNKQNYVNFIKIIYTDFDIEQMSWQNSRMLLGEQRVPRNTVA
jgi:hypothetical protein